MSDQCKAQPVQRVDAVSLRWGHPDHKWRFSNSRNYFYCVHCYAVDMTEDPS